RKTSNYLIGRAFFEPQAMRASKIDAYFRPSLIFTQDPMPESDRMSGVTISEMLVNGPMLHKVKHARLWE
ncbi:hypothetical protein, partial [Pseudomonas syringae group genomosp. 3]|uniref:hypothetical protein n=1 Tax=Pseudomonas syringae group genomosp. 3 TaxID=251701 RepID=UPI001EE3C18A